MAKYVQKGKAVWLSTKPAPAGVSITAATKAEPAVLTVANTLKAGDIVRVEQTGLSELDGKAFEVESATATEITLLNADTTSSVGTFNATNAKAYFYTHAAGMVETCFSSFDVQREAAATIAAATFCGTDSLAGQPGGTTINVAGFDDPESDGLKELIRAYYDGLPRVLEYIYPASASSSGKSYRMIFPSVTVSGFNGPTATPDGAAGFTATLVANGDPTITFL